MFRENICEEELQNGCNDGKIVISSLEMSKARSTVVSLSKEELQKRLMRENAGRLASERHADVERCAKEAAYAARGQERQLRATLEACLAQEREARQRIETLLDLERTAREALDSRLFPPCCPLCRGSLSAPAEQLAMEMDL